jgi:2'-5' RNA ligase
MGKTSRLKSSPGQYCLKLDDEWQRQAPANRPRLSNLMILLKPSDLVASTVYEATRFHCQKHPNGCSAYAEQLLHVSALWLGGYPEPPSLIIRQIVVAAETLHLRPIKFTFDHTELFGNRKHLVLAERCGNHDFNQFVRVLQRTMTFQNVLHNRRRGATAHMTIIYDRKDTPIMPLERPLIWTAHEFILVYSWNGQGRHEEFGRWRFSSQAAAYSESLEQLQMNLEGQYMCSV